MKQPKAIKLPAEGWRDLRDARGKLCARIHATNMVLEVRRNHETVVFDLREYKVYFIADKKEHETAKSE